VADPAKSPVTRRPGARLGLGEGRGVDGNQVGALTDVEDGGEQLKSGDGREVAVDGSVPGGVLRQWSSGDGKGVRGATARHAGPYGGDGLLQSALTAANRAAAGGELGGRLPGGGGGGSAQAAARREAEKRG
jgi:hypothetical protein